MHPIELLTSKDGLAFNHCSFASPFHNYSVRIAGPTGCPRSAPSWWCAPKYTTQFEHNISSWWWRGWHKKNIVWMEGMETCRSNANKQLVEEQNGKWYKKTIGQRRSVHNVGPFNRLGDGGDWLLVIGQLLVTRAGKSSDYCSLTNTKTANKSDHTHQCGERVLIDDNILFFDATIARLQPRKRLASGGCQRTGFHESLTSRHVRKEWY